MGLQFIMMAMRRGFIRATAVARLDWTALQSKVTSDAGKAELAALRGVYSELAKASNDAPSSTPVIDWAKWSKAIKTPGVVDEFKSAYGKLSVPAMADTFSADVGAKFAAAIEGAASASEVRIKELEEQLAALDNRPNWSDVTIEEELAKSPEIAAEIEEEISQQKW